MMKRFAKHLLTLHPKHICLCCVQVESETTDAELKLNNATQRLHKLEQDVTLLRDKALNITQSTELTNQEAVSIRELTEEVKKVSSSFISSTSKALSIDQIINQCGSTDIQLLVARSVSDKKLCFWTLKDRFTTDHRLRFSD